MSPFIAQPILNIHQGKQWSSYNYSLYAIVYHIGNLHGGHYIVEVWNDKISKWIEINDTMIRLMSDGPDPNKSKFIYAAFYQRIYERGG